MFGDFGDVGGNPQAVASIFGTVASLGLLAIPTLMAGFRTDKAALEAW